MAQFVDEEVEVSSSDDDKTKNLFIVCGMVTSKQENMGGDFEVCGRGTDLPFLPRDDEIVTKGRKSLLVLELESWKV